MSGFPLWANVALFAAAAALTWLAGSRLTRHVDALSPGGGATLMGALVLGGITSLPEAATVATAAALGGATFAAGNIVGSASANLAILAGADVFMGERPIVDDVGRDAVGRQAGLLVVLLATTAAAVITGEPTRLPVGLWTVAIAALAGLSFYLLRGVGGAEAGDEGDGAPPQEGGRSGHVRRIVGGAAVIVAAGYLAARSGTIIAGQTGLSGGFVGFALLGVATSLPELSTTTTSVRIGRADLAVSNVLGTNIFNHLLFLVADMVQGAGGLFDSVDQSAAVGAMLASVLLGIYLVSVSGQRVVIAHRVGLESVLVLIIYAAGTVLLSQVGAS